MDCELRKYCWSRQYYFYSHWVRNLMCNIYIAHQHACCVATRWIPQNMHVYRTKLDKVNFATPTASWIHWITNSYECFETYQSLRCTGYAYLDTKFELWSFKVPRSLFGRILRSKKGGRGRRCIRYYKLIRSNSRALHRWHARACICAHV